MALWKAIGPNPNKKEMCDLEVLNLISTAKCSFESCVHYVHAKGLCSAHYNQRYRGKPLTPLRKSLRSTTPRCCAIRNCTRVVQTRWLCGSHSNVAWRFNLSRVQLIMLLDKNCEACGSAVDLSIDHGHDCCERDRSCGKCIRGVLCGSCNTALGQVNDNVERLQRLIQYLQ